MTSPEKKIEVANLEVEREENLLKLEFDVIGEFYELSLFFNNEVNVQELSAALTQAVNTVLKSSVDKQEIVTFSRPLPLAPNLLVMTPGNLTLRARVEGVVT